MRPTTSTTTSTNNSKNIRQISQIFWKLRSVSTPIFSRFNSTIWRIFCGSSFRFLTHSRYNFKWDCERRVKFGLRYPCFGENYFVIYREGKKLIGYCYSPPWLRMEQQNLCQIMAGRSSYSYLRNFPELWERKEGGRRRIFLSETEIRIYETQVTKSRNAPATDREVARYKVPWKEGSVNLIDWERDDRKRAKTVRHSTTETTGRKVCQLLECFFF